MAKVLTCAKIDDPKFDVNKVLKLETYFKNYPEELKQYNERIRINQIKEQKWHELERQKKVEEHNRKKKEKS